MQADLKARFYSTFPFLRRILQSYNFVTFILFALFIFSKMCQEDTATHERYTCASTVANFNVDKDGTTYIIYQSVLFGTKGYERFVSLISASNFFFFLFS